ncbi:MAG: nucleoside deaminase [Burkholderiales bacterium]
MDGKEQLNEKDRVYLERAIALSLAARQAGKHPFAATVIAPDGAVLAEAGNNSLLPDGDPTQHAELRAVQMAARVASSQTLAHSTLYSSAEPCAMCAGAVYWCGVGRVVYALSEQRLLELTGSHPENPTFSLPCREVFSRGQRHVEVVGPCLEEVAAKAHEGFWRGD